MTAPRLTPARLRVLRLLAAGGKLLHVPARTKWRIGPRSATGRLLPGYYYTRVPGAAGREPQRESVVLNLQHEGFIDSSYRITPKGLEVVAVKHG